MARRSGVGIQFLRDRSFGLCLIASRSGVGIAFRVFLKAGWASMSLLTGVGRACLAFGVAPSETVSSSMNSESSSKSLS